MLLSMEKKLFSDALPPPSPTNKELLHKIKELTLENNSLIEKFNKKVKEGSKVSSYTYIVTYEKKICEFIVTEHSSNKAVSTVLSEWRSNSSLSPIDDIFNDRIDYQCHSFDDIGRLNSDLSRISAKYALFGESEASKIEIEKFLNNIQSLSSMLKSIENLLQPQTSTLQQYTQRIYSINNSLKELKQEPFIRFDWPWTWFTSDSRFKVDGNTVTKTQNSWHSIRLNEAIDTERQFSITFSIDVESSYTHFGFVKEGTVLNNWLGELAGYGFFTHSTLNYIGTISGSTNVKTTGSQGLGNGSVVRLSWVPSTRTLNLHARNLTVDCSLTNVPLEKSVWFVVSLQESGSKITLEH